MSKEKGLSKKEAEERLQQYGLNEIEDVGKISPFRILIRQSKGNFIIFLLFFAMAISFFVGKSVTAYAILAVIILVVTAGFIQEYKAEKAIESLKKMLMPVSVVIRDCKEQEIQSREIVIGDILVLRNGERIPADCVVLEQRELFVDESILTGEAKEVEKKTTKNEKEYKDENMLFMGSFVVSGKCIARVIHTGMNTRFGQIAGMISRAEKELPLQKKVNHIAKYMSIIAITMAILTGIIVLMKSPSFSSEILIGILILVLAIAVSAFPEGLPVVLISTLSLGAFRMAKKDAIVNRMAIIETLGETTVICSDKTGTITKGEMTVREISVDKKKYKVTGAGFSAEGEILLDNKKISPEKENILKLILRCSVLCNDARIARTGEDKNYKIGGSPTQAALLIMAAKEGYFREDLNFVREEEVPFSSERKMMSVLYKEGKEKNIYSLGAFEVLINKCKFIQKENGIFTLRKKDKELLYSMNKKMTSRSLRVVALAYKNISTYTKDNLEKDLVFLGLAGMEDPPREEVKEALSVCKQAGISVKMITGDNKDTALSIAKEINLDSGGVLEGSDIDRISDSELSKMIKKIVIFARVRPEHKLRIVRALKENGEIVTMTGDGVNDAPALKEAHIGVAMGKNGTDVSRSVADLVLKNDNFATIVDAVKEGRTIFRNMKKFVSYQLSCNLAELSIIFFGVILSGIFGWPVPLLLALQILFMNLVTDNVPAITLGFNSSSKDIMEEKPRKNSNILNKNLFWLIILTGGLMALLCIAVFYIAFNILHFDAEYSRTSMLVSLILLEIAGAFNFRSFRKNVLNRSLFINKYLFYASLISILATILIVYSPLNKVFETVPINFIGWALAISTSLLLLSIFDFMKNINNKKRFWQEN